MGGWTIVNYGGQYFRVLDTDSSDFGVDGGSVLLDSDWVYGDFRDSANEPSNPFDIAYNDAISKTSEVSPCYSPGKPYAYYYGNQKTDPTNTWSQNALY